MRGHKIVVMAVYSVATDTSVEAWCEPCDVRLSHDDGSSPLDELNRLAHEHIEAADRAPLVR